MLGISLFGLLHARIRLLEVMVSLGGASLSLPSLVTPQFNEFFSLGRVLRTTLPTGRGRVWRAHVGRVRSLMLLADLGGRIVLGLARISSLAALVHLLLTRLVRSRIGGSLLIFLSLLAFVLVVGRLMLLALRFASLSGLLVGLTLPIGPPHRLHGLSKMLGMLKGMILGLYPDVVLSLRDAVSRSGAGVRRLCWQFCLLWKRPAT